MPWECPHIGNIPALGTSLPCLCLGAALLCRLLPALEEGTGDAPCHRALAASPMGWVPTSPGCPWFTRGCGASGASLAMGDTEPVAALGWGIALRGEEGAGVGWDGHCGAGGAPLSCPGLVEEPGTGTPPVHDRAQNRLRAVLFKYLGLFFLSMDIKVFVWSPPMVLDWVSRWHRPAWQRESVPGSAPLPGAGHRGARGGQLLVPAEPRSIYGDIPEQGPPTHSCAQNLERERPGDAQV